jgi:hypothetical protein
MVIAGNSLPNDAQPYSFPFPFSSNRDFSGSFALLGRPSFWSETSSNHLVEHAVVVADYWFRGNKMAQNSKSP